MKNVTEKEITGLMHYETNDNYWTFMNDVAAPVVGAMSKADDATRKEIRNEVFALLDHNYLAKKATLEYQTLVVSGEK